MKTFGMHTSAFIIELPFQSFQIALQKDIICPVVHVNMFQILGSFLFLYRSRTLQIPIRILYIVLLTLYHLIPFVSFVHHQYGEEMALEKPSHQKEENSLLLNQLSSKKLLRNTVNPMESHPLASVPMLTTVPTIYVEHGWKLHKHSLIVLSSQSIVMD